MIPFIYHFISAQNLSHSVWLIFSQDDIVNVIFFQHFFFTSLGFMMRKEIKEKKTFQQKSFAICRYIGIVLRLCEIYGRFGRSFVHFLHGHTWADHP